MKEDSWHSSAANEVDKDKKRNNFYFNSFHFAVYLF